MHQAVREALVNAMVHADLQGNTGIRQLKILSSLLNLSPNQVVS